MTLVRNSGSCLLPAIRLQLGGEADVVGMRRPLQDRAGSLLQKLHPGDQMSLEFCRNWTRTW